MQAKRKTPEGIRARHSRSCKSVSGGGCNCAPTYEAFVYSAREGKKLRKSFPTLAAARNWRADASTAVRKGTLRSPVSTTIGEAWDQWVAGAREGTIRTRSGDKFKPSALHGYAQMMQARVLPWFAAARMSEVNRHDLQDFTDGLLAEGLAPSTVRNALMPLRAVYRRAVKRGDVAVNPTIGLDMPAVRGRRDRIASPAEAVQLLAVLDETDRAIWATALYAGMRRGELLGLRWEDVDLQAGLIRVERAFDPRAGLFVAPKSRAGVRRVPIAAALREFLIAQRLRAGRTNGLVFGASGTEPFDSAAAARRAKAVWRNAGLVPIGLHEARHTFASLMIAAGVNAKALATYMGHSSVTITYDRYGHLMPGNEGEAAALLDRYLGAAADA